MIHRVMLQKLGSGATESEYRLVGVAGNHREICLIYEAGHEFRRLGVKVLRIIHNHGGIGNLRRYVVFQGHGYKFRSTQGMRAAQGHNLLVFPEELARSHPHWPMMFLPQAFEVFRAKPAFHGPQQKVTQPPGEPHHDDAVPALLRPDSDRHLRSLLLLSLPGELAMAFE